jgi:ATP:ADP antiporter, AAA family
MVVSTVLSRFGIRREELRVAAAAFLLFFLTLCSYYILRPVRDELGTRHPEQLQWLFTGTFIASLLTVPVFGVIVSRFSRRKVVPVTFLFFAAHLILFYSCFARWGFDGRLANAFFIWLSVYNMFVVSAMWSLLNDVFDHEQAERLYGFIAAGGSAGAILGPLVTAAAVRPFGVLNLILLSGALLLLAVPSVFYLFSWSTHAKSHPDQETAPIGGGIWNGVRLVLSSGYLLKISLLLVILTFLTTAVYFEQAAVLRTAISTAAERTRLLARIDLAVNIIALLVEITIAGPMLVRFGAQKVLLVLLLLNVVGFALLGSVGSLGFLVGFQVFRRASDYALIRPVREIFFTVVSREEKYKAKNFVDVVVVRGGDALSGWLLTAIRATGLTAAHIALLCAPIAALTAILVRSIRSRRQHPPITTTSLSEAR